MDSLIDYRSRRPVMTFAKDHWEDYEAPELALSLLHDAAGTPFLLLNGLEPDREWEAFTTAVQRAGRRAAACGWRSASTASRWASRTPGRSASPRTPPSPT